MSASYPWKHDIVMTFLKTIHDKCHEHNILPEIENHLIKEDKFIL